MEGAIELESLKPQIDANQVLHRPGKEREEHNHDWDVQVRESREDEVSGRVSAQDLDNPHLPPVDQVRNAALPYFYFDILTPLIGKAGLGLLYLCLHLRNFRLGLE